MLHAETVSTNAHVKRSLTPLRNRERVLRQRRLFVTALNVVTVLALMAAMAAALSFGGWSVVELGMFLTYSITLPWLSIGFWNAVIGTVIASTRTGRDELLAFRDVSGQPITTKTAIVMALRNEDPEASFARLRAMADDLSRLGVGQHFDFHVLSDTNRPETAAEEERLFAEWGKPNAHYRRRTVNTGYKAGNLEEFCARAGSSYDYFLPLDADSMMSGAAIMRLVRLMQRHREIGILQSLVVGTPAANLFTRVFQFGMRHGMRSYSTGSAWWTGDCGPYWGHNALIRMRPFRDACTLPVLPGKGPLGGHIMSHDQVEAVLMRRAGYHVRVLVEEGESWEENPPTLPDFIRRELRWCQGNMQYFGLLGMSGLKPVSRVQLVLAILMYLGSPAWMAFVALSTSALFFATGGFPGTLGVALFATIMTFALAPKLMGVTGLLLNGAQSARYGGRLMVVAGAFIELVMSMLLAPIVGFAIAVFAIGLFFGRKLDWRAQPRGERRVAWDEAVRSFWPQTLFGATIAGIFWVFAPAVLPWAAPMLFGFLFAVPLAVWTAHPALGAASRRLGLCDIPEDRALPDTLAALGASDTPAHHRLAA